MDNENKKLLNEEITRQLQDLQTLETGSDTMASAVKDVVNLYELSVKDDEIAAERCKSTADLSETKKDRYVKIGLTAAEIILPLVFYGIWLGKGMKFEETGCFTSTTVKGLINRFRPTK